jgi:FkbM family methyltransferase
MEQVGELGPLNGHDKNRQILLELLERKEKCIADFDGYRITGFRSKVGKFFHILRKYGPRGLWGLSKVLPFSFRCRSKTFWGRPIEIILPENLMTALFGTLYGGGDLRLAKFLVKNLKADDVFYDIGSHIGFFSLVAAELIETGEVHAFDPNPKIFPITKDNLSGRKNCFVNQIALSNKEGEIDFFADVKMGSGLSSIDVVQDRLRKIRVKTTTLDTYCLDHAKPTFMKMDIEGAEGYVIEGGPSVFEKSNPTVVMEFSQDESHQKSVKALYGMGYKSYKINDEGELEKLDIENFIPFDNIAFVK